MDDMKLESMDRVFCKQSNFIDHLAICTIDGKGDLYLVNDDTLFARKLPDEYQKTPILLYHSCGGYKYGLIMVSLMGEVDLQYHHNFRDCAGMWGWIDTNFNTVIRPEYIYAQSFFNGLANVCKGRWNTDENNRYWCDCEQWGVIDLSGAEVVPCRYDELYSIDNTTRLFFVHQGGWENGAYCIYDTEVKETILTLDFDFDCGYMFNSCFVTKDSLLVFTEHFAGEGKDLIYAYDLENREYVCYALEYSERTFNGQKRITVQLDGEEVTVF